MANLSDKVMKEAKKCESQGNPLPDYPLCHLIFGKGKRFCKYQGDELRRPSYRNGERIYLGGYQCKKFRHADEETDDGGGGVF